MNQLFLFTVISYEIAWISVQAGAATSTSNPATLRFATPLPTSVEIFISSPCPAVTKWMIQYRKLGTDSSIKSTETKETRIHAARVTGLDPNTIYEFRTRASQVNGDQTVTEIEYPYPDWDSRNNITTDSLSIFGKVTLTNFTYTFAHRRIDSAERAECLTTLQEVYRKEFSVPKASISILMIENSATNNPIVHYKVKVPDPSLPSKTNYTISGPGLVDNVINNGDTAMGNINIGITSNNGYKKYTLWYDRGSCPGGFYPAIVERYMIVSPEDSDSESIHLNVAPSDATSSGERDSLVVQSTGGLRLDNGAFYTTVSRGIFIGLTPKFLIKDCLRGSPTSTVYSEVYGPTLYNSGSVIEFTWDKTEYPDRIVNASTMSCISGVDGKSIICDMPTIHGGYKYDILNGTAGDALGTVAITDATCSETQQVIIRNLSPNITYDLGLEVAIRNSDGTLQSARSPTTIRVETIEYIPTTTIIETTVLPSTTTMMIDPTTIFASSTEDISTTEPSTIRTNNPNAGTTSSIMTRLMSTTSISSASTEKPMTTTTTSTTTGEDSGNDCTWTRFWCSFNHVIWIFPVVACCCVITLFIIIVLCIRASRRRKKYKVQSRI